MIDVQLMNVCLLDTLQSYFFFSLFFATLHVQRPKQFFPRSSSAATMDNRKQLQAKRDRAVNFNRSYGNEEKLNVKMHWKSIVCRYMCILYNSFSIPILLFRERERLID